MDLLTNLLSFLRKKGEIEGEDLFNIEIKVSGWEGPFRDFATFLHVAEAGITAKRDYSGSFFVRKNEGRNGRLIKGTREGLHKYAGEIDLEESPFFGVYHVHHDHGVGVSDIIHEDGNLFLSHIFGDRPIYTLQGLYNSLPNQKINTKINALKDALNCHAGYEFESIAQRKETKLKLLENDYRRLISNQ